MWKRVYKRHFSNGNFVCWGKNAQRKNVRTKRSKKMQMKRYNKNFIVFHENCVPSFGKFNLSVHGLQSVTKCPRLVKGTYLKAQGWPRIPKDQSLENALLEFSAVEFCLIKARFVNGAAGKICPYISLGHCTAELQSFTLHVTRPLYRHYPIYKSDDALAKAIAFSMSKAICPNLEQKATRLRFLEDFSWYG